MNEDGPSTAVHTAWISDPDGRRLSNILRAFICGTDRHRISVGDVLGTIGERAYGTIFISAAPNVLPVPGFSSTLGAPLLLFLTWQLAPGRPHPWLPHVVRNRSLDERRFPALDLAHRPMARTAGAADSSSPFALTGPVAKPLSRVVALLAILLFLPIPFGNILPAFGLPCLHLAFLHGTNWPLSLARYPRSSV
jgi:hypothetical protein